MKLASLIVRKIEVMSSKPKSQEGKAYLFLHNWAHRSVRQGAPSRKKAIYMRTSVRKRIVLKSVKIVRYSKSKNAVRNVFFNKLAALINVSVQVNLTEGKVARAIHITDGRREEKCCPNCKECNKVALTGRQTISRKTLPLVIAAIGLQSSKEKTWL